MNLSSMKDPLLVVLLSLALLYVMVSGLRFAKISLNSWGDFLLSKEVASFPRVLDNLVAQRLLALGASVQGHLGNQALKADSEHRDSCRV